LICMSPRCGLCGLRPLVGERGWREEWPGESEMGPRWARRPEEGSPQESAGVPANTRERARKKANRERLTFIYWWWGGSLCQTYITQRLRTAANSCGTARNPAPAAGNRISSCQRRHPPSTSNRPPVRFPNPELNQRPLRAPGTHDLPDAPELLPGRPNVVLDHRLGLGAQEGIRLALALCGRPSLPDGGDTPAAVTEGALDEVERVGAPVCDAAEPDDHLGIFSTHAFRV